MSYAQDKKFYPKIIAGKHAKYLHKIITTQTNNSTRQKDFAFKQTNFVIIHAEFNNAMNAQMTEKCKSCMGANESVVILFFSLFFKKKHMKTQIFVARKCYIKFVFRLEKLLCFVFCFSFFDIQTEADCQSYEF